MPFVRRLAAAAALLALGAGCHSDPTEPEYGPDAESRAAAATFSQVADSLNRAGADAAVVNGYYGLARYVSGMGRTSPVTISIDGIPEEYLGTAQEVGLAPTPCPAGPACLTLQGVRGMVAWRRGDPRRVLQLTGGALTFFDGRGGFFAGGAGTGSIELTSTSEEPCFRPRPTDHLIDGVSSTSSVADPYWTTCKKAEFRVAATGTVQPPPAGGPRGNSATGSLAVAISPQPVHGGQLLLPRWACLECAFSGYPEFVLPPLTTQPRPLLSATLTADVTDVVTLTFTVKNAGSAPATIRFDSGQQYDFAVVDLATTRTLWQWSANKSFPAATATLALPPGEQLVITERWTPPGKGQLMAQAALTSSSHKAYARLFFVVP